MQSKSRGCAPRSSNSAERVSAAAGEDGVLGLCGLSMLADIVLHCRIGVGKLEFYRDFAAFVYINHEMCIRDSHRTVGAEQLVIRSLRLYGRNLSLIHI